MGDIVSPLDIRPGDWFVVSGRDRERPKWVLSVRAFATTATFAVIRYQDVLGHCGEVSYNVTVTKLDRLVPTSDAEFALMLDGTLPGDRLTVYRLSDDVLVI